MYVQIGPVHDRLEEGLGSALAHAVFDVQLVVANAFLILAVKVFVVGNSAFDARLNIELGQFHFVGGLIYPQTAADTVKVVLAANIVLGATEIGQQVIVAPAAVAGSGPGVVVLALAANIDHTIDGAGAPQYLATRPVQLPVVKHGLGLGFIAPAGFRVFHGEGETQRNMQHGIAVLAARFEQKNSPRSLAAQAIGERAAG